MTMPNSNLEPTSVDSVPPTAPATGSNRLLYVLLVTGLVVVLGWLAWYWHQQQPPQRFRRGLAALDSKDSAGVRRELNGWPSSADYEPHRHFLTGALLLREGKPVPALDEFQRSVNHSDLRVRTLTLSGGALYQLGRQVDAIELFLEVLAEDPKAVDAHRWLGSCYYDLGANQQALTHLTEAADLDPHDPRPHRLIGLMHKDFEHFPDAIAAYQESLRRSAQQPDVEEIRLELAECLVKQRQYDEALVQLKECAASPARHILEAECLRDSQKPVQAMKLVDSVLAAEPENLKALTLKGTAYLEDGDVTSAVEWLGKAVTNHPFNYAARFKYAQALRRSDQTKEADDETKRATEIKAFYDQFTEQHALADKEPDNVAVRHELGLTALNLGRPDLAVNWFRMALALDPNHVDAQRELQKLQDAHMRSKAGAPRAMEKR